MSTTYGDPTGVYARVVTDSISTDGVRLTSFEVQFHRFVLAEVNTHCVISRNSASSRAIPYVKQRARVLQHPAVPVVFPAEQAGMQGGEDLCESVQEAARHAWLRGRSAAVVVADGLRELGVHKSVVNRVLEPFQYHKALLTATAWDNFFDQRAHPAAQPEFRVAAEFMREALAESTPTPLHSGWHLPYLDDETREEIREATSDLPVQTEIEVSVARCARTSYMTQDGERDFKEDLKLFERLATGDPPHMSPFEHVATPALWNAHYAHVKDPLTGRPVGKPRLLPNIGKFLGYLQYRHLWEARSGHESFR